jgi:hypothetical protein
MGHLTLASKQIESRDYQHTHTHTHTHTAQQPASINNEMSQTQQIILPPLPEGMSAAEKEQFSVVVDYCG